MKIRTKIAQLSACSILIASLAACGNGAPSESDAKQAIEAQVGDCKYVEIEDFSRINGQQVDDQNHYQVQIKYTLKYTPDSDQWAKLKQWGQLKKDFYATLKDENKLVQEGGQDAINSQAYKDDAQKALDLQDQVNQGYNLSKFSSDFIDACPGFPAHFLSDYLYKGQVDSDGVNSLEYTATIPMVKTDNGWQLDK